MGRKRRFTELVQQKTNKYGLPELTIEMVSRGIFDVLRATPEYRRSLQEIMFDLPGNLRCPNEVRNAMRQLKRIGVVRSHTIRPGLDQRRVAYVEYWCPQEQADGPGPEAILESDRVRFAEKHAQANKARAAAQPLSECHQQILKTLKDHPDGLTVPEIAKLFKTCPYRMRTAMEALIRKRLLVKRTVPSPPGKPGIYRVVYSITIAAIIPMTPRRDPCINNGFSAKQQQG